MQDRGLVHPEMLERLQPNFYPSLCTIQERNATKDSYGGEVLNPLDLPGHVDIACRISPRSSQERRLPEQVYAEATHTIALNGYYPAIASNMLAVVDGAEYQIEGPPQHDGNGKTTRLYVREVI